MTRLTRNGKCVNARSFVVAQFSFNELLELLLLMAGLKFIASLLPSVSNDL
jgi:hypothetical protein